MSRGQALVHVGEERFDRRLDAGVAIRGPHGVELLLARLLHDVETGALRFRQGDDGFGYDFAKEPRALRSTRDEDGERAGVRQVWIGRVARP